MSCRHPLDRPAWLRGRFDLLEDTLRFAHGMWESDRGSERAFVGRRLRAERALNSPQALSRPHPRIRSGDSQMEMATIRSAPRQALTCPTPDAVLTTAPK